MIFLLSVVEMVEVVAIMVEVMLTAASTETAAAIVDH